MPTSEIGGSEGVEILRQANLLKTGALQDAIFNSANFSSIATDERGVIQIFNVGAERMLGYAAPDVLNRITPADISDPQELIARARALSLELDAAITPGFEALVFKASRGIEDIYELTYIRKDGSRFPAIVSVTALRNAEDKIIGYLLIGTDNTSRKQIEEARALLDQRLRDQQFYTRSLIESNIDALMTTNSQGIISDVNEQMIALTGRTRDELIGAPCKNFFTDPVQAEAAIKRVLVENKVRNYELTVRALNGEETVVSYNAATFHDRDRNLQGVIAAARDVTEQKRFEHTLQEKNLELEHASRMKSAFLATMSHELRTPLNAIIGFSEALQQGLVGKVSETQREYIGDIFTSGQHLLSLINDILDLSKVEAGRLEIEHAPLSIADVIENTCGMLDQMALKNNVDFTFSIDPDIPATVLGDALRLRQVLLNLVSNAIKFSCGRALPGRVSVRAQLVECSASQAAVDIHVSDNGIGMDQATKLLLFTAFSQADASTTRRFGGTGLGLAISRHLLDLMGGRVTLESAVDEGSTFSVRLNCALPQDGAAKPALHASAARLHEAANGPPSHADALRDGRLILVVEDNEINQKVIVRQLELLGFAAQVAANGKLALDYLQRHRYGLLLTDLHMPEMDGYALAAAIRARESGARRLPIVALTASALAGEAERCRAAGMDDYLCKPLQLMTLKIVLEAWLPATAASPQLQSGTAERGAEAGMPLPVPMPPVDVAILKALVGSDPVVVRDFLRHFQCSAGNIVDALHAAYTDRNPVRVAGQAHKLKASARTVGALALGARCAELESAGKSDGLDTVTMLLPAFEREFAAVNQFLDALEWQYEDRRKL